MEPNAKTQDRVNAERLFEHAEAIGLTPEQIRDAAFYLQNRPMRAEMVQAVRETLLSSMLDAGEMIAVLDEVRKELAEKCASITISVVDSASAQAAKASAALDDIGRAGFKVAPRDPRVDPKPGDVLVDGLGTESQTIRKVLKRHLDRRLDLVEYLHVYANGGRNTSQVSLRCWQDDIAVASQVLS